MKNTPLSIIDIAPAVNYMAALANEPIEILPPKICSPADEPFIKTIESHKPIKLRDPRVVRECIWKQDLYQKRWFDPQQVGYCFSHQQDQANGVLEQIALVFKGRFEIPGVTQQIGHPYAYIRTKITIFEPHGQKVKLENVGRVDEWRSHRYGSWKITDLSKFCETKLFF